MPFIPEYKETERIQIPDPAAGANLIIAVPANEVWIIKAVTFQLQCSGVALNRAIQYQLTDPVLGVIFISNIVITLVLNEFATFFIAPTLIPYVSPPPSPYLVTDPYPPLTLFPGDTLEAVCLAGLDIGDQFQNIFVEYERHWIG